MNPTPATTAVSLEKFKESFQKILAHARGNHLSIGEKIDVAALFPPERREQEILEALQADLDEIFGVKMSHAQLVIVLGEIEKNPQVTDGDLWQAICIPLHGSLGSLYLRAQDYEIDWTDVYDAIKKSIENKSAQERIDTMMEAEDELQMILYAEDLEDGGKAEIGEFIHSDAILDLIADFQEYFLSVIDKEIQN